ncbi:MAG TPA: hypothetical protein VFK13_05880 [Gemmatimonadaceae bacterium]|nr:hypothetical protein [Gemmatimonadaceae bacterium]
MACFYCAQQTVPTPDNGLCVECSHAVCTSPPLRKDRVYHGLTCRCECRKLVCKYDAPAHARSHHRRTIDCFPASAGGFASDALETCVRVARDGRSAERLDADEVERLNHFLSFAVPGHQALLAALDRHPGRGVTDVVRIHTSGNAEWPAFDAPFYSGGALDRVAALSARTLAVAANALSRNELGTHALERLVPLQQLVQRLLPAWLPRLSADWIDVPESAELIATIARGYATAGADVPAPVLRAITYTAVPEDAEAIADWVVEEPVSVPVAG